MIKQLFIKTISLNFSKIHIFILLILLSSCKGKIYDIPRLDVYKGNEILIFDMPFSQKDTLKMEGFNKVYAPYDALQTRTECLMYSKANTGNGKKKYYFIIPYVKLERKQIKAGYEFMFELNGTGGDTSYFLSSVLKYSVDSLLLNDEDVIILKNRAENMENSNYIEYANWSLSKGILSCKFKDIDSVFQVTRISQNK